MRDYCDIIIRYEYFLAPELIDFFCLLNIHFNEYPSEPSHFCRHEFPGEFLLNEAGCDVAN
jgi:hypothetical protein